MLWSEIRAAHPDRWVVVEARNAHSAQGKRLVEEAWLVDVCADGKAAVDRYAELRRREPLRELYYLHTTWEKIELPEEYWHGIRPSGPETNQDTTRVHERKAREAEREIHRRMSPRQKLQAAGRLYKAAWTLEAAGFRAQNPDWTEEQVHQAVRRAILLRTD